jgi:hypothetical protein
MDENVELVQSEITPNETRDESVQETHVGHPETCTKNRRRLV